MANTAESQKSVKGTKTRKPRKELDSITIKPSDNKGYIATHRYVQKAAEGKGDYPMQSSEEQEHVFGSGEDLMKHMHQHLKIKEASKLKGTTSKNQPAKFHAEKKAAKDASEEKPETDGEK